MNTPYSNIYNRFLVLVSNDRNLLTNTVKNTKVTEKKLKYLLDDAIADLMLRTRFDAPVDFTDKDDILNQFNFELTLIEEKVLSNIMMEKYVDENTIVMINNLRNNLHYTDKEIQVFCPANSLSAFEDAYNSMKEDNDNLVMSYKTRDRKTFKKNNYKFENEDALNHEERDYDSLMNGSGN